ncbi:MAG: hypothetical protein U9Q81_07015 [Pseudomonadota bacterium]|nr:hypothetical protein [Pseudomonadota bacterium]
MSIVDVLRRDIRLGVDGVADLGDARAAAAAGQKAVVALLSRRLA